jgi:hypothetical protein
LEVSPPALEGVGESGMVPDWARPRGGVGAGWQRNRAGMEP